MMRSGASQRAAISYLQRRIIANWLRRSIRSPFFWLIVLFVAFVLVAQIVAIIEGGPEPPAFAQDLDPAYPNAVTAIVLLGGILIGLWRGTTNTPGASLADVFLLMGSPVPRRWQFALLMFRTSIVNALVIGIWALVTAGGILLGVEDSWIALRLLFLVMIVVLLSEFLRYAVWTGTEQVVVRSPQSGNRYRLMIRGVVFVLGAGAGAWLLGPIVRDPDAPWQDVLALLAERGDALAVIPPLSLAASVSNPEGASVLSAIVLAGLTVGVGALALYWATDFVEPVAISAEHKTDPRGQILEAGSDVQWAGLAQFGVAPRLRTSIPPFGRGAWALLWGGLIRWLRYQIAAAWISLAILGILGVATAIGVRIGLVPIEIAWAVVLMFPFFGSVNMFMDELRRQFIFLVPGSTWARLIAAAVSSALDGLFSSLLMILVMIVIGALSISEAAALALLSLAISILGQASVALVQVRLPIWIGQRVRIIATFGLTGAAFLPALLVLVGLYVTIGPIVGLLAAASLTFMTAIIILVIAAFMFDRIEFTG